MDFKMLNMLFKCSKEFSHKKIKSCGLSDTECLICSYVYQFKSCSQDDVVQGLRMDKTTAAKALQSLEEKGFIERDTDISDKRKKVLNVTQSGIERCAEIINLHDKWFESVMSALLPEEQEQFERCCEKLLKKAEKLISEQQDN